MNQNSFDKLNDWIRDTENSIVNFLSAFAPWLAPIIPAYMTYQHADKTLHFPLYVAIPAALVVEILGFSAVSTYLAFWFYNRRNSAATKKAPLILVVIAFGFYLSLIIFSNVLLDTFPGERWAEIVVRALFTLQTIPAAMLVSVRTQHRELLSEIAKERAYKKGNFQNVSETEQKDGEDLPESFRNFPKEKDWRSIEPMLTHEQVIDLANLSPVQARALARRNNVTEKSVTNWRANARRK